eukprot:COSAG05_NODE_3_length_51333_cov_129.132080_3_plen_85_part_00
MYGTEMAQREGLRCCKSEGPEHIGFLTFTCTLIHVGRKAMTLGGDSSRYGDHSPYKFLKIAPLPSRYVTNETETEKATLYSEHY